MESTSNLSDVFRFVNLRPAQKLTKKQLGASFITYDFFNVIPPPVLSAIETTETLLLTELNLALTGGGGGMGGGRAAMEAAVTSFRSGSAFYWETKEEIDAALPGLSEIVDHLISVDFLNTATTFKAAVESVILPSTIAAYLADADYLENKLRLWDNLFAEYVLPRNIAMRDAISNYIRVLYIMEEIDADNPLLVTPPGFRRLATGTLVLPKPTFPLPAIVNDPIDMGDPIPNPMNLVAIEAAVAQIELLTGAQAEILEAMENQINETFFSMKSINPGMRESFNSNTEEFVRETPMSTDLPDAAYLSHEAYESLSTPTKGVFDSLGISSERAKIDFVADKIQKAMGKETKTIFERATGSEAVVVVGGTVISVSKFCFRNVSLEEVWDPCSPFYGTVIPIGSGNIQPLGIADLLVVKQQLLKYELGEIAHIENILLSEKKEREHRKLNRIEETVTFESERSVETTHDTQTTERFSIEKEASSVIQENQSNQSDRESGFGITLSGSYGPVSMSASYNNSSSNSFVSSSATIDSEKNASSYAKEVTDKALKRVIERVREQRSRTTIDEVIETNTHGFDNTAGSGHIAGVYHWVDKYYLSKIVNYGKRLMFEFMIPEPAAFHIYSKLNAPVTGTAVEWPKPLKDNKITKYDDITEANYSDIAALYGVTSIAPPPPLYKTVNRAFNQDKVPNSDPYPWPLTKSVNDMEIPDGYYAETANVRIAKSWSGWVQVWIGTQWASDSNFGNGAIPMNKETGILPIAIMGDWPNSWTMTVEINCRRADDTLNKWKIGVYAAILEAYNRKKAAYDDYMAARDIDAAAGVLGNNPDRNREIEREELKRASLELLTSQKFDAFNAMQTPTDTQAFPVMDDLQALGEGNYVKFFEQAFEWHNLVYLFYPYFWGRKQNWVTVRSYEDTDPLFTKFLQAGYARVVVPVRPIFTEAILHFVKTGQLWNGGAPPTINDELYLSIVQEIKESQENSGGVDVGEPWEVKVPTNLVMLQSAIPPVLPDFSDDLLP